jgi:hypothetical protein
VREGERDRGGDLGTGGGERDRGRREGREREGQKEVIVKG